LRHLAAAFGTPAAGVGASLHNVLHIAGRHLLAMLGAPLADISADAAGSGVKIRAADHKIRARLADLHAVLQKLDMFGAGVFAAHLQTMTNGFQTNRVTVLTILDAIFHFLISFV
jgi:hypothetical protein